MDRQIVLASSSRRGRKLVRRQLLERAAQPVLEQLEDRTLFSVLDISGANLAYTAGAGIDNNLTVSVNSNNGNLVFQDTAETISLSGGAVGAGWTSDDANTVEGPASSVTGDFTVNLQDGNDQLNVATDLTGLSGTVTLQSGGSVSFAGINTTGDVSVAATTLSQTSGTIAASSLFLSVGNGIGTINSPVLTQVGNLEATTTAGDIDITNNSGNPGTLDIVGSGTNVTRDGVIAAAGSVQLINSGTINVTSDDNVIQAFGAVTVEAQGAGADIVTGGQTHFSPIRSNSIGNVLVTAGGNISLGDANGFGNIDASQGNNTVQAAGNITVDDQSAIQAVNAGDVNVSAGGGVTLAATDTDGALIANFGNGSLTITGSSFTENAGTGVSTGGHGIAINADTMTIGDVVDAGNSGGATPGNVTLAPETPGTTIDLGTNPSGGNLGLSSSDINEVTATVLTIGNASSGSISISAPTQPTGTSTLSLITGGAIIDANAGTPDITVTNLALQAVNGIGGAQPIDIAATTVAASNASAGSIALFDTGGDLTVGAVAGVTGVTNTATSGQVGSSIVAQDGSLTISNPVSIGDDYLTLTAGATGALLKIQAPVDNTFTGSGSTEISFDADNMSIGATVTSTDAIVLFPVTDNTSVSLGGTDVGGATPVLGLDDSEFGDFAANSVVVNATGTGNISVDGDVTYAGVLQLRANAGAIVDGGMGASIQSPDVRFRAATGIGAAGAIALNGPTQVTFTNNVGAVAISDDGALTVAGTSTTNGTTTSLDGAGVTVAANLTSAGDISVDGNQSGTTADNITVDQGITVESTAGRVQFTSGNNIDLDPGSAVKSDTDTVDFTLDDDGFASFESTIQGTLAGSSVSIDGSTGPGADGTIVLDFANGAALPDGLTYNASVDGIDTLTASDAGDTGAHTYTITGTTVVRDGSTITYGTIGQLNVTGGDGAGTFNVQSTSTPTNVTGGAANDTFNIGNSSNSLGDIGTSLSIDGGDNDATTTTAAAGTAVAGSVVVGDTVNFNDQGDAGDNLYTLGGSTLDRIGVPTINFQNVETLALNSSTGIDAITESAAPTGVDHVILTGNSSTTSSDTFNLDATAANTITEATGGAGNDIFNLGNGSLGSLGALAGAVSIAGGSNIATTTTAATGTQVQEPVVVGDTVNFKDSGDSGGIDYTLDGSEFTRTGAANVAFQSVETMVVNLGTGNDSLTVSAAPTGVDHLIYNGNSVGDARTSDTFNIRATASGSATEVNGGTGDDVINIAGNANNLDNIIGVIAIDGGEDLGDSSLAADGTQVSAPEFVGDTLNISDAGETNSFTYGIGANLFSTSGVGDVAYTDIQTFIFQSSTGTDTINVGTSILPTGAGPDFNPAGGASSADHVIIDGNSTSSTADTINIARTGNGSVTEVNGGDGNDVINVGNDPTNGAHSLANLGGAISINGGDNTADTTTAANGTQVATSVVIGNTVNIDDQDDSGNDNYGIGANLITRTGAAPIAYTGVQTLVLNASQGNDVVDLGANTLPTSTPAPNNLLGGASTADRVIINSGSRSNTADTINIFRTSAGVTEINGATITDSLGSSTGNDLVNIGNEDVALAEIAGPVSASNASITLNDQGDSGGNDYGIGANLITRSGLAGIAYSHVPTLTLNIATDDNTIDVGTATLPAATPATVDVNGGAVTAGHLIINGSDSGGSDTFNLAAFSSATASTITGSAGDDTFNVTGSSGAGLTINGGGHNTTSPGDTLTYDANGGAINFTPGEITSPGFQDVTFNGIESTSSFTDSNGSVTVNTGNSGGTDSVSLAVVDGTLEYTVNGVATALPAGTNSFTFNGDGDTNTLVLDYSSGGLPTNITDNSTGGSILKVVGDPTATTIRYVPSTTTNGDGTLTINGTDTINFNGLAPIDITGMQTVTIAPPSAGNNISITNGDDFATGTQPALLISGTTGGVTFETAALWNNTNVIIDTTTAAGDDIVTFVSADDAHNNSNLTVTTGTGADTINVNGNVRIHGNLTMQSGDNITLNDGSIDIDDTASFTASTGTISEAGLGIITANTLNTVSSTGTDLSQPNGFTTVSAVNNTSGSINIQDSAAGLNVTGATNSGNGDITIDNSSTSLTISGNISAAAGTVDLTALNFSQAAATTISGTAVTIVSDGTLFTSPGSVTAAGTISATGTLLFTLNSSAQVEFDGALSGSSVTVNGVGQNDAVTVNFDQGASLPDGMTFAGATGDSLALSDATGNTADTYTADSASVTRGATVIDYTNLPTLSLTGGTAADTFNITPASGITFNIVGNNPTPPAAPGDALNIDYTGLTGASVSDTLSGSGHAGSFTFTNAGNVNYTTLETLPVADLFITTSTPASVTEGSPMTYTVTVTNNGPLDATNVSFLDTLPAGSRFLSASQSSGSAFSLTTPAVDAVGASVSGTVGTLASGDSATFLITVAPDEGLNLNSVTVTNDIPDLLLTNETGSVTVMDATLTPATAAITSITEGASTGTITLGTFTDSYADAAGDPDGAAAFSATIIWGDGTTSPGTITQSSSNHNLYTVTGSNTYTKSGTYPIAVHILDVGGASTTINDSITVNDAAISATSTTLPFFTEGAASGTLTLGNITDFYGSATGDPRGAAAFTATIHWGDGATSAGTIAQASFNPNLYTITSAGHTYTEFGDYDVTVSVNDVGGKTSSLLDAAIVSDAALTAAGKGTIAAVEGASLSNVVLANFTDADPNGAAGDYVATIVWGDGSTSDAVIQSDNSGGFNVLGTHTFKEEGSYTATATIHESDNFSTTAIASDTITVSDPAVIATAGSPITEVAGKSTGKVIVATFTDPGGAESATAYSATINWGDGTGADNTAVITSAGKGVFNVYGTHTFSSQAIGTPDAITVTVHHESAPDSNTVTDTAAVFQPAVVVTASKSIKHVENSQTGFVQVASFTDPNGAQRASSYTAIIDWGDGHIVQGRIQQSGNTFIVLGNHTFKSAGRFLPVVTVLRNNSQNASATGTAVSVAIPITATGTTITGTAGNALRATVAKFTTTRASAVAADYIAVIDWGDGDTTDGTIVKDAAGKFHVVGTITYPSKSSAATYHVKVTIDRVGATTAAFVATTAKVKGVQD